MKRIIIFFLFLVSIIQFANAQLSGTYTIGGSSPDYTTIGAAISALNSQGVNSSVIFQIASGTYNEQLTISNINGASSSNTITFTSASGDSSDVIISNSSSSSLASNYTLNINAAKHIIFSKISLKRTGTNNYSTVIENTGLSEYIKFQNCHIENSSLQSITNYTSLFYSTSNLSKDFSFENNLFKNGSYAIYFEGVSSSSTEKGYNLSLINNVFDNQWRTSVYAAFQYYPEFDGNVFISSSTYFNFSGLHLFYCDDDIIITNNKFDLNKTYGIKLSNSFGSSGNVGLIQNNFISMSGSSSTGLEISSSGILNIYFNSFNIYGSSSTGFNVEGAVSSNVRFINNLIVNSGGNYTINLNSNATTSLISCDYNNLYSSGTSNFASYNGNAVSNFNNWKSTSSFDANSVSFNTSFASNTDLHVLSNNIAQKGSFSLNSPFMNSDIDGEIRNPLIPDIGADEFSLADLELSNPNIDSLECDGNRKNLSVEIKNLGTTDFTSNVFVSFKYGNDPVETEALNYSSLSPGASISHTFSDDIKFNSIGTKLLEIWISSNVDVISSNDSLVFDVTTNAKPSLNLGNDVMLCAGDSAMLDAGAGFDSYLWSDGSTSQFVFVDSVGIGLTPTFFGVEVSQSGCSSEDSVLIIFKDCTSIKDISDDENISIFPNPAENVLNISIQNFEMEAAEYLIFDLNSKLVLNGNLNENSKRINTSNLNSGHYLVYIFNDKYKIKKAFIINR